MVPAGTEEPGGEAHHDGETHDYLVVPIDDAEFERVNSENPVGPIGRFLMGYPPRRIVRLDPA
jgi:hypothetical protein